VSLSDELARVAERARASGGPGEELSGVLATEPIPGLRIYLCAFESAEGRAWLALDEAGEPVDSRSLVRDAASIAALVELAADAAGGGQLEELRSQLVSLRLRENPPGIEEAEEAALALEHVVAAPPRLATPALLDEIGVATRRLELALGTSGGSPFAETMKAGTATVEALVGEIEAHYKAPLG
jgi:hypothetical protein